MNELYRFILQTLKVAVAQAHERERHHGNMPTVIACLSAWYDLQDALRK